MRLQVIPPIKFPRTKRAARHLRWGAKARDALIFEILSIGRCQVVPSRKTTVLEDSVAGNTSVGFRRRRLTAA